MKSQVGEGFMRLEYLRGGPTSSFVLRLSPNPLGHTRDLFAPADIVGLRLKVSGSVSPNPKVSFCGATGGIGQTLQ